MILPTVIVLVPFSRGKWLTTTSPTRTPAFTASA
jgi:hypothetical protein